MDECLQDVRERRQRQSLLELDRHGMELRPLTQAFVILSKRNSNWWADTETRDDGKKQASKSMRPTSANTSALTSPSKGMNSTSNSKQHSPAMSPLLSHNGTISSFDDGRAGMDGTKSESSLTNGGMRRPISGGLPGPQTLSSLQAQWSHNYGTIKSNAHQRPTSAASSRLVEGSTDQLGTPPLAMSYGTNQVHHSGHIRKTSNPAFNVKTADAIQLGLALAQQQKENFAKTSDALTVSRRGAGKNSSLTTTVLEVNDKITGAQRRLSVGQHRPSSAGGSSAIDPSESRFQKSSHTAASTATVDPFKSAPIPSLVDDPTAWLRSWQHQEDEKKRFSKEGPKQGRPALNRFGVGLESNEQAAGTVPPPSMPLPSLGADVIIPDTIVWENNIPKGWFYYDKKERLVCKRKVDTKAVQMALLDGAQYENDTVAVLYMMGQSTLGGNSTSNSQGNTKSGAGGSSGGGNWHSGASSRSGTTTGKGSFSSKARRSSSASTAATSRRRDSLMTTTFSETGAQSVRRGSDVFIQDEEDPDEDEASREARLAHIKKLKQLRYLKRSATDLTEDIQSRVLHCRFITAAELPSFLFDVGGKFREKGTCILQKMVYSIDVARLDIFQAVWTPQMTHVTRRQNVNNLFDERIPVFQRCTTIEGSGAEHYSQPVQITTRTQNQIKAACDLFSDHFKETNPKFHITRMICHFRLAGTLHHDPIPQRDQRLVFLFCSSARVMPIETRHYSRLYAKYRVCLDVDVPIVVDEGEVADAQSRLIALGTGPDGLPLNEADPYADCTSATTTNNLEEEKRKMLRDRHYTATNDAQTHRASNPYKTTNVGNSAFVHSVMAATGSGALQADPSNHSNGSLLQSFLASTKASNSPSALIQATVDKALPKNSSSSTKSPRGKGKGAVPTERAPANALFQSLFTEGSNNATVVAPGATSKVASPYGSPKRNGVVVTNFSSPDAKDQTVTVKAVMEHVTTTENYLRGAISSSAATGGKKRGGRSGPTDANNSASVSRQGSVSSDGTSLHGSPRRAHNSSYPTASGPGTPHNPFHKNVNDTSQATSTRRAKVGIAIMVPRPKLLIGMNANGTKHVVDAAIKQVGLRQCRAAYLDTVAEKHLTSAEKAELLCLKYEALTGRPISLVGTDAPIMAPSFVPDALLDNNPVVDHMAALSEADLLKASFIQCAKDHLLGIVYDCYSHYDGYRASLMRRREEAVDAHSSMAAFEPTELFTFYLSPSIETTFAGTLIKKHDYNRLASGQGLAGTEAGESSDDEETVNPAPRKMSVSNLLDKYHPLKKHAASRPEAKIANKRTVRLPPLCAPVEALFAVYLSRLQRFQNEEQEMRTAGVVPRPLYSDAFLSATDEDERILLDGDCTVELVKLAADACEGQHDNDNFPEPHAHNRGAANFNGTAKHRTQITSDSANGYEDDEEFERDSNDEALKPNDKNPFGSHLAEDNVAAEDEGPKSLRPTARACTDGFADLILRSCATELPKPTSIRSTPPLAPSASTPANRSFSLQHGEEFAEPGKKSGSKTATVVAPRDHEGGVAGGLVSVSSQVGNINASVTSGSNANAAASGYINLSTIFKDAVPKNYGTYPQPNGALGDPRVNRFGLARWLRQYYGWDPTAMAEADEVIEVQLHPTDLYRQFHEDRKKKMESENLKVSKAANGSGQVHVPKAHEDSDSDFSDVEAPQSAAFDQQNAKKPLTSEEIAELHTRRHEEAQEELAVKRAHRSRDQLFQLSKRLPQQLHHYVLSFVNELRSELLDLGNDEDE